MCHLKKCNLFSFININFINDFFLIIQEKFNDEVEDLHIKDKVIFGKEVVKIYWSGDQAEVLCADNSRFKAQCILTTMSLGVLKNVCNELFEPELPEYKLKAIQVIKNLF